MPIKLGPATAAIGLCVSFILGGGVVGAAQAEQLSFSVGVHTTPGDNTYLLADYFRKLAEEKGGGDIKVNFLFGGAAGNEKQLGEQVELGTLQVFAAGSSLPSVSKVFGIFEMPFFFPNRETAFEVIDGGLGEALNTVFVKEKGLRVIGYGELGFRQVFNNVRPINVPADLKGMKLRVPPNRFRLAALKALGASPTSIPVAELYTSVQQGVVDGFEVPAVFAASSSLWDVAKYMSITNHVFSPGYLVVNNRWWQGLSAKHREILAAAGREAALRERQEMISQDQEIMEKFRVRKNLQINEANAEAFEEAMRPIWKEFRSEIGPEIVDLALELRSK